MLHDVRIWSLEPRMILELRGDPEAFARVAAACALPSPTRANSAAAVGDVAVAWVGPRRWLIQGPAAAETALLAPLERAVDAEPLLDLAAVGDMIAVFAVDGAGAVDVLAQGCALDLDGLCADVVTGTEMWGIGVVLCRVAGGWEILVDRSLAGYLESWLLTAAGGRSDRVHAATQFFRG